MNDEKLCPFSKPLIGQWCRCPHARLTDRCSGKMTCCRETDFLESCQGLVAILQKQSQFILGTSQAHAELTHTQLMKIRCGGLRGMSRELGCDQAEAPLVRAVIDQAIADYGHINNFPFETIIQDIQSFSHRKQKRKDR